LGEGQPVISNWWF
jgi:Glucuronate isomerase